MELNDFIFSQHERDLKITESLATIAQSQVDMSTRLFGGSGQVGMLTQIIEASDKHLRDCDSCQEKTDDRLGALEGWKLGTTKWIAGAVAALALEGTALGMWFQHLSKGH